MIAGKTGFSLWRERDRERKREEERERETGREKQRGVESTYCSYMGGKGLWLPKQYSSIHLWYLEVKT